jgi:hypothetical protein
MIQTRTKVLSQKHADEDADEDAAGTEDIATGGERRPMGTHGPVVAIVFRMHHIDYTMSNDAVITVRVSRGVKQKLEARAARERRSLSAQIATYLEQGLSADAIATTSEPGTLLGLYAGTRVPTDEEIGHVRDRLWRTLGTQRGKRGP